MLEKPVIVEQSIGKAGDPLPPFENHMIRQRVTFHGAVYSLPPAEDLPACTMHSDLVGVIKVGPVRKWLDHKRHWEKRFRSTRRRVREQRLRDMATGYEIFSEGDVPPSTSLAGRRKIGGPEFIIKKKVRGLGLALWSLWGSKHDEMTVQRERDADTSPDVKNATSAQGEGARTYSDIQRQEKTGPSSKFSKLVSLKPLRKRSVMDEMQVVGDRLEAPRDDSTMPAMPTGHHAEEDGDFLWPGRATGESGATGKRMFIEGLATPFSVQKEADTASMITLQPSRPSTPGPNSFSFPAQGGAGEGSGGDQKGERDDDDEDDALSPGTAVTTPFATPMPMVTPGLMTPGGRPELETFVTAQEVPRANS